MLNSTIDFRSDTITQPSAEMLDAMFRAEVGDDVFGDDPTMNAFEENLAKMLGKESAVFVPTGTMANQIAIKIHTRHGDSIICEENAHCYLYEGGASAAMAGVQFDFIPLKDRLASALIESRFRSNDNIHCSPTTLLVVENSHNRGGGRVLCKDEISRITSAGKDLGLRTHCDGARIWNAAIAAECSERDLLAGFDTAAVCFSKGLGAPIGSALVGSLELITAARRERKRYGGAMRQVGYLAAAADFALKHNRERLADDHAHAATLTQALALLPGAEVVCETPATNIVYVRFSGESCDDLIAKLAGRNVAVSALGDEWIRLVTHMHIDSEDVATAIAAFEDLVSG